MDLDGRDASIASLCGIAKVVRGHALALNQRLATIVEAADGDGAGLVDKLAAQEVWLKKKVKAVDELFAEAEAIYQADPVARADVGEPLAAIADAFETADAVWPRRIVDAAGATVAPPADAVRLAAQAAAQQLDDVVYRAAALTLVDSVNAALHDLSVGESLNFAAAFTGSIPEAKLGAALQLLQWHSARVHGWIDGEKGVIYKTSSNRAFRVFTYAAPILTAACTGAILYGADLIHDHRSWREALSERNSMLVTFLAVLAGAVLHLMIGRLKRVHFNPGDAEIVALSQKLTWLHLRWTSVCQSIVPVLIVWGGMRWWHGSHSLATYFFAGYSVDSMAEIFLGRLDLSGTSGARMLIDKLKASGASAGSSPAAPAETPAAPVA